jgi:16S rRNA (guanine966-N2)-methyltransferase
MRIVAGEKRGLVLSAPKSHDVIRPTADRVRETLFNVLGQRCDGWHVLDLYAGTGALALESLSRGAVHAVLVDAGREAQQLCVRNAQFLGYESRVEFVRSRVEDVWPKLLNRRFDLIFADPPYKLNAGAMVLARVESLLGPGGMLVLETGRHEKVPLESGVLRCVDERSFGDTLVRLFR